VTTTASDYCGTSAVDVTKDTPLTDVVGSVEGFLLDWRVEIRTYLTSRAAWIVTGVTLVNPSNATSTATVRLSGGSAGVTHMVARGGC
jgi:hypothetical protein